MDRTLDFVFGRLWNPAMAIFCYVAGTRALHEHRDLIAVVGFFGACYYAFTALRGNK